MSYYLMPNGKVEKRNKAPKDALGIVPETIDRADWGYLKVDTIEVMGVETEVIVVDDTLKATGIIVKDKKNQGENLKKQYVLDIGTELESAYGTTDQDRAIFLYLTFARMVDHPEEFSDKGLKDDGGSPLDTDTKVFDYATVKIMRAVDYSIYVLKKIETLRTDLDNL